MVIGNLSVLPRTASLVPWSSPPSADEALICLGWAGAGAAPFRMWAPAFAGTADVYGVRLPGRESRFAEPALTDVEAIVAVLAEELEALPARRISLFGHCSGALLAYRLALELGPRVRNLFVASQFPPAEVSRTTGEELATPDELARRYVSEAVRTDESATAVLLSVLLADLGAISRYRHRPEQCLHVPVTVFHGGQDAGIRSTDLHGWHSVTTGRVRIAEVAHADHLFSGAAWAELAEGIAGELESGLA